MAANNASMLSSDLPVLDWLRGQVDLSDAMFFSVIIESLHLFLFVFFTLAFFLLENVSYFDRYRIRPKLKLDPQLTKATIRNILMGHTAAIPYLRFVVWPVFAWGSSIQLTGALPHWHTIALQILGSMLIEDFLFYWMHRLSHLGFMYKYVHKKHHQYKNTISYAAEYATPLDQTISNVFPTYAGPFLFRMHFGTLLIWITLRLWETFDAHSGYVLPWSPWNQFLAIQGGTVRHDFHHSHNAGSFGSFFKFWDWAMGTDVPYRTYLEHQSQAEKSKGDKQKSVDDDEQKVAEKID